MTRLRTVLFVVAALVVNGCASAGSKVATERRQMPETIAERADLIKAQWKLIDELRHENAGLKSRDAEWMEEVKPAFIAIMFDDKAILGTSTDWHGLVVPSHWGPKEVGKYLRPCTWAKPYEDCKAGPPEDRNKAIPTISGIRPAPTCGTCHKPSRPE